MPVPLDDLAIEAWVRHREGGTGRIDLMANAYWRTLLDLLVECRDPARTAG